MRAAEACALAAALKARAAHGPPMQTLVVEHAALPVPQLLGLRELPQGAHKKLSTACARLEAAEVRLMTAMLAENSRLESLQLTGSMIGSGAAWLADALSRRSMPLTLLHLAEHRRRPRVALVGFREGIAVVTELDLGQRALRVEEGGRDDFTVAFVDALCGLLGGGGGAGAAPPATSRLPTWRCAAGATATARTRRGDCAARGDPRLAGLLPRSFPSAVSAGRRGARPRGLATTRPRALVATAPPPTLPRAANALPSLASTSKSTRR